MPMLTKDHIKSNIIAILHQNSVNVLITNLADASMQIQERDAELAKKDDELAKKDAKIAELEAKVKELESQQPVEV